MRGIPQIVTIEYQNQMISLNETIVASKNLNHPDPAERLNQIGCDLKLRFIRFGSVDDLDRAIQVLVQSNRLVSPVTSFHLFR